MSATLRWKRFWRLLVGQAAHFAPRHRLFNAAISIAIAFLLLVLLFNALAGIEQVNRSLGIIFLLLLAVYFITRKLHRPAMAINLCGLVGLVGIPMNYSENAGIDGPSLFAGIFTLAMLMMVSDARQRYVWWGSYTLLGLIMLYAEYTWPDWVPPLYQSRGLRFLDMAFGYTLMLAGLGGALHYLRLHYDRAAAALEQKAHILEDLNAQLCHSNTALNQLNEEKIQLFSIISHDLRNSITGIYQSLGLLRGQQLIDEEKQVLEDELDNNARQAVTLVANLLSWGEAQMGGLRPELRSLDAQQMIGQAVAFSEAAIAKKGLHLRLDLEEGCWLADANMMQVVLRNVLGNAVKFSPPGSHIRIAGRREAAGYCLAVSDEGTGISPDQQAQLFKQLVKPRYGTAAEKGAGLGLFLCHQYMQMQQGSIEVESVLGEGSTFFLRLPLGPSPEGPF